MPYSSEGRITQRPPLFRALGREEPPLCVTADGRDYTLVDVLKHDSWASTARYRGADGQEIACKFGRRAAVLGVSGAWIGRRLAQREARALRALRGCDAIPQLVEPLVVDGVERDDAIAHVWIAGATFTPWTRVDDQFFPRLSAALAHLHADGIAHNDMAKWENILVGDDGQPWLLDFQIHLSARRRGPWRAFVRCVQTMDRFYLARHWSRARPDQQAPLGMPLAVRIGEMLGSLWRPVRIAVLRVFGVNGDPRRGIDQQPPR